MDARLTGVLACLGLVLGACASGTLERTSDHPMAGRIYRVADASWVSEAELIRYASGADFVLIGERHDNPEHHRLQALLVAALQQGDGPRAVAFEMIPADRQLVLVEYLADGGSPEGIGEAVAWDAGGWPSWSWYQPIAEAALANGAQIVGADLTAAEKRAAFVEGAGAFRPAFVARTGLGELWPAPMMVSLQDELRAAHCEQVSGRVVIGMMRVQRARDAMMADRLAASSGTGGGALIAGNGHVRKDRGVPWYLERRRPDGRSISIGLVEVQDGMRAPPADLPYDYVWFTPRVDDRGEPCDVHDAELRAVLQTG